MWRRQLDGVQKPWLCWNVDHDWCLVQQKLVRAAGWTPVVGFDPRVGQPPLLKDSVLIDFNASFNFEVMYPHFVIEFSFLFSKKLAFWHSDLLLSIADMRKFAQNFEELEDGSMAAVIQNVGMAHYIRPKELRYWELLGCMTAGASESNFETGCGWWLAFYLHPMCPGHDERLKRLKYHWECGVGIRYWKNKYSKNVLEIPENLISRGHFTRINNPSYKVISNNDWRRNLSQDLRGNFTLEDCCKKMQIDEILRESA